MSKGIACQGKQELFEYIFMVKQFLAGTSQLQSGAHKQYLPTPTTVLVLATSIRPPSRPTPGNTNAPTPTDEAPVFRVSKDCIRKEGATQAGVLTARVIILAFVLFIHSRSGKTLPRGEIYKRGPDIGGVWQCQRSATEASFRRAVGDTRAVLVEGTLGRFPLTSVTRSALKRAFSLFFLFFYFLSPSLLLMK